MQRFQLSLSYISTQHIESITQVTLWIYDGVLCESKFGCLYCLSANSFKCVLYTQRFTAKLKKILFQLIISLNFCQIQNKKNFGRRGNKSLCCLVSLGHLVIVTPDGFGYIIASKLGEIFFDIASKFCNCNQQIGVQAVVSLINMLPSQMIWDSWGKSVSQIQFFL